MTVRNLDRLVRPRSVALIGGAAPEARAIAAVLGRNLLAGGFEGPVMPVAPAAPWPGAERAFASVDDLPTAPDLAVIAAPQPDLAGLVARLGSRGTAAALIVSGDSAHGADDLLPVLEAARPHLLRIIGPGSLGLLVPGRRLNASLAPLTPRAGDIAFIGQSAGVVSATLDWAAARGIGFSHVAALGGQSDVDVADMLDYLASDGAVRTILLHLETVPDARKLLSAGRAAARQKPVIVIRGRRGVLPARRVAPDGIHAPALADDDAVYDAAFRRAGMLRVRSLDELFDAVGTLAGGRRIDGDRLAILTNAGGVGALAVERLTRDGGRPARLDPPTVAALRQALPGWDGVADAAIDIGNMGQPELYARALPLLAAAEGVDAILVLHCPTALTDSLEAARIVCDAIERNGSRGGRRCPVAVCWAGSPVDTPQRRLFAERRIPHHQTPDQAIGAFLHLVEYRRNQDLLMEVPALVAMPDCDIDRARTLARDLAARGIDRPGAAETAALLGAAGIAVASPPPPLNAGGEVPVLEFYAGIAVDPLFGPVVVFGQGGVSVEIADDRVVGLPPLNRTLAGELMARTRIQALLRERPHLAEALAGVLIRLSLLATEVPELRALDLHPLVLGRLPGGGVGVVAGRAEILLAPAGAGRPRPAIRPYPRGLEKSFTLADGRLYRLRPIRPEDAPLVHDMVSHVAPEDLRLRFFAALKTLSPQMVARLTQIDYDREMALIALDDGGMAGAVRIAADPDSRSAEYAVLVRSDLKGHGLGYRLMIEILDYARTRGIVEVTGEVLRENTTMLKMATELGFRHADMQGEPGIVHVSLDLSGGPPAVEPPESNSHPS